MSVKKLLAISICAVGMLSVTAAKASAVPLLQLYVEGGIYDATTETWVTTGADPLRLWVIADIDGPGAKGTIAGVKIAIAYSSISPSPTFTLTSSTTAGFGGYGDPSTPSAPAYIKTVADGSSPVMSDGGSLAPHGIYGPGTSWQEFALGDFTLTDSPIGDFVSSFPAASATTSGEIKVYEIAAAGLTGGFHIDAYGYYSDKKGIHAIFAPFSHDAEWKPPTTEVPEPGALFLLGAGVAALAARRRSLMRR